MSITLPSFAPGTVLHAADLNALAAAEQQVAALVAQAEADAQAGIAGAATAQATAQALATLQQTVTNLVTKSATAAPATAAFVYFGGNSSTTTPKGEYSFGIRDSFNVASVVRNNPGDYTINFVNPFPDTYFTCVFGAGFGGDPTNTADQSVRDGTVAFISEGPRGGEVATRGPGFVRIIGGYENGGSFVAYDIARLSVAVFHS